jgi:hypothetical protein
MYNHDTVNEKGPGLTRAFLVVRLHCAYRTISNGLLMILPSDVLARMM